MNKRCSHIYRSRGLNSGLNLLCMLKMWLLLCNLKTFAKELKATNLLLIMFDDLRPELSIYGRSHMITPNFERLAAKSVVYDYAFCQIAVCNPSRDSLMTGLRPDSVGTYNFGHSYAPHLSLPAQLVKSGYNTAGIGKIFHWESNDKNIWNFDHWDNRWYDYQNEERGFMNSSTMPDRITPVDNFRDALFVKRALKTWKEMIIQPKPFMMAIGFKHPHLALHVPHKYFTLYRDKRDAWKLSKRELRFPLTASEISYRCCAEGDFQFMREEGSKRFNRSIGIGDINVPLPEEMHDELMMGYCAAVSFLDDMIGKLLDFMDENKLWDTTTVVLTADHGMHNGEKGIWEKWTLFEEATRIPLIIHHPLSPFMGARYPYPVESIDVYATLNELLKLPITREKACAGYKCKQLQGKSLVPTILGKQLYEENFGSQKFGLLYRLGNIFHQPMQQDQAEMIMPLLEHNFALSQVIRCTDKSRIPARKAAGKSNGKGEGSSRVSRNAIWTDCDAEKHNPREVVLLGYAMRTPDYRYIAYFNFNRTTQKPELDVVPYAEELYDHKNETLADFTHRETFNLAVKPVYGLILQSLRNKLVNFIRTSISFGDH